MNDNKHGDPFVCEMGAMPWINSVADSLMGGNLTNITRPLAETQNTQNRDWGGELKLKKSINL